MGARAHRAARDGAGRLGVASAVTLPTATGLLAVVVVGGTWYAGSRLRTLRLTSDE